MTSKELEQYKIDSQIQAFMSYCQTHGFGYENGKVYAYKISPSRS